jgi:hypothetical protein
MAGEVIFYQTTRSELLERAAILLISAITAHAATKIIVGVPSPITPAADTTKALATSSYCSPVTVLNLTTSSVFSSIPAFTGCAEVPLIISPGLPTFPAGSAYVAYPNSAGTQTIIGSIPAARPLVHSVPSPAHSIMSI